MKKISGIKFIAAILLLLGNIFSIQAQNDLNSPIPLDPRIKTGKLKNGLTYFIMKNQRPEKRAELRLVVNTGSIQEDNDQQGLAHFCEHMAFNGTTHFKKNELVDYLESVGVEFGPDLNAYTSFDETVYMLQVPTDSSEVFNKGFLVLEDWAQGLLFDPEEVKKERGVVIEEWRIGKGAEERMRKVYFPLLFKGSQYADRLPIGKKEVLDTCSVETLSRFYKNWYRPDLMAVIAIGDFDLKEVEARIIKQFSSIPVKKNPIALQKFPVPDHKEIIIAKATDKEASYTTVNIYYKHPVEHYKTKADYRKKLGYNLFIGMLNNRLSELTTLADPPFSYAGSYYGNTVRTKSSFITFAYVKDLYIGKAIETILTETERARRHGFTSTEMQRQKESLLSYAEKNYNERDKTESQNLAYGFADYFLEESPLPGPEFQYNFYKKYLDGITLDEVNSSAAKFITEGENLVIVIKAPEKEGLILPNDEKLLSIVKEIRNAKIDPYIDVVIDKPLVEKLLPVGKIISEKKVEKINITEWTLSNGAKIILKPTDFKNDEIRLNAFSWGGSGLCTDDDYLSAENSTSILDESGIGEFEKAQLNKYMQGKIVWQWSNIGETSEEINGQTTPKDLETLLQLIYLGFTDPRVDSAGYSAYISKMQSWLENEGRRPENAFYDTVNVIMAQYHPRKKPMTLETLKEIKKDKAFRMYRERFSDAGDFTFIIVGAFNPDTIRPLIEKYIACLPSSGKKETWKDIGVRYPIGKIEKTVKRGIEPKSRVRFDFTGDYEWNSKNNITMNALMELMKIKLREKLREEKGGTYGVSIYSNTQRIPIQTYDIMMSFGCSPENVDSLSSDALGEIEKIKKSGPEQKDFDKVKELMKRANEVNMQENGFWGWKLSESFQFGDDPVEILSFEKKVDALKPEDLKSAANRYFDMKNVAKFVLMPEK